MTAPLISAEDLSAAIATGAPIALFDCDFDLGDVERGRRTFADTHLPGARYLHLDEDLSGPTDGRNGRHPLPDREAFAATLRRNGLRSDQWVVAYDASGGPYAARLWWMLRWIGHAAVSVLDGGRPAWIAAGLPLETGLASPVAAGDIAVGEALTGAVTADDILATRGSQDLLVVDARTAERFRGEPHPLDPVSGCIPGAANRFYRDNLGPDGRFKSAAQLAAEWAPVLGSQPPAASAMQCGSGVSACHNLLALEVAGLPGAKLYPGSWSEWISDPSRPVDRGTN